VFAVLTLLRYLLTHIEPKTKWRERLFATFDRFGTVPLDPMDISADWRSHELWR
jgi:hypothetical protein